MRCAGGAGCDGAGIAAVEEAAGAGVPAEAAATLGAAATAVAATEEAEPPAWRICLGCGRRVKVRGVLWGRCCFVKTERAS